MIVLERVSVVYGRTLALDGVDLRIPEGVTGVFGQNGAGKSTLLRVIAGLLRPTSGAVTINGAPIDLRDEDTRRRISYSGHASGLYGQLSVQENLDLFARLHGAPLERGRSFLAAVGIEEHAAVPVRNLSAGLKRRASVARALTTASEVLILDEPYANLDDEAADSLSRTIEAWAGPGRYALIATHGAKRVKSFATGSLILKRGIPISFRIRTETPEEETV